MQWVNILVGAVLLLFGRRLFWLFVGCIGFIAGFDLASNLLQGQSPWVILVIAACVGLIGAIAAIFLERLLVGIAGFFAGGYFLSNIAMAVLHNHQPATQWIAYAIGGIIGAILTMTLLDPALIILSSLAGATAITQNLSLNQTNKEIVFIALLIFGIVVQALQYRPTKKVAEVQRTQ
jgi:MFS family permease